MFVSLIFFDVNSSKMRKAGVGKKKLVLGVGVIMCFFLLSTLYNPPSSKTPPPAKELVLKDNEDPSKNPLANSPFKSPGRLSILQLLSLLDLDIRVSLKAKNWAESEEKPKVTFVTCPKKFPSRSKLTGYGKPFFLPSRPNAWSAHVAYTRPST